MPNKTEEFPEAAQNYLTALYAAQKPNPANSTEEKYKVMQRMVGLPNDFLSLDSLEESLKALEFVHLTRIKII